MKRAFFLIALAFVLAVPSVAFAATYIVRAEGEDWVPAVRRIVRGDSIQWRNPTSKNHDIRSRGSNWSYHVMLEPGERATRRFGKRGIFRYRCTLHSAIVDGVCKGMCGTIRVRLPG